MVYCVQAELAFSTAARRDQVLADIQSGIATLATWDGTTLRADAVTAGQFGIVLEVRFTTRAAQQSIIARIEAFAQGQRRPLAGSLYVFHDCAHDEGNGRCGGVTRKVW